MTKLAIEISGLGKKYRIGGPQVEKSFREFLTDAALKPFRSVVALAHRESTTPFETIWALKDVSLEIQRGEVIGFIGRNGAGKSTLLKILSRITQPTTGYAKVRGRTGSLLEVGTGFHHELTGRENVYLNGAILGMRRQEIDQKFDEIVDFSGIENFIDTPVKHYSSGMYLRLAFAVAAHLEPENLFIDEVLAVGDAAFQKKCLGKMSDVANTGRTILFVSHNMPAVQGLCHRTIWLDNGQIREDGPTGPVVSNYLRTTISTNTWQVWDDISTAPNVNQIYLHKAAVYPQEPDANSEITVVTPFNMEFEYWNHRPDSKLMLSLTIFNEQSILVFSTANIQEKEWSGRTFPKGLFRSVCHVPGNLLNKGTYRVRLLFFENEGSRLFGYEDILTFDVLDSVVDRGHWYGEWGGVVRPNLQWNTELLSPST